ncbi:outer membrane lipid asymmetry maintenance protein MlaD [Uliginosibacterium sp. 31-12]|uniref:outer membrane lipid asymmetry maintenance protein MlaD n=1 Tax=Uliginosibacterium sp. 31-12 TaxID=3062781 RepID=UPI0026E3D75D|nr:outer membrane lipid asymmetry maintenance protein MlaD [Uliginosibacterium sp. 31-12]MDO6385712.1 outer membrane lipid asymmetry maintenance protein MlaD [Uliginosibacterium sp. 31-12]
MKRTTIDIWVGIFVVIGFGALLFLAMRVGNLGGSKLRDPYELQAKFDNIGGLKVRAPVKSAGVVVGRVEKIVLDSQTYQANVTMQMDARYAFPQDTFATINTSGLLGEQYIGLEPGGDEKTLAAGEVIKKTQSAVVLEKLISQFMFSTAEGSSVKTGN